jgi:diguanylate cyclase (GGDEF)-like protein
VDGIAEELGVSAPARYALTPSDVLSAEIGYSRKGGLIVVDRVGRPLGSTGKQEQALIDAGVFSSILDLAHPLDRERVTAEFRTIADGFVNEVHFRSRVTLLNGDVRVVEVLIATPTDVLQTDGIIVSFADVTETTTAEALRAISRRIALSPLEATNDAIDDGLADAMAATGLTSAALFVPGESGALFHVVSSNFVKAAHLERHMQMGPFRSDMASVAYAIAERRAVVIQPGDDDDAWRALELDSLPPLFSIVIVPLVVADRVEGLVVFGNTRHDWQPRRDFMAFLETAGELIAGSLERQRASLELHDRAFRDMLTGLPNRRLLTDRLDEVMARIRRSKTSVALIVIDCDGFKEINDSFGHHIGDGVLIAVADRLQSICRSGEFVARFGGDEFVVMVESDLPEATVLALGERIVEVLDTTFEVDGNVARMTASVGVAVHRGDGPAVDATAMFKRADLAMYRAKERGKNRVAIYTEEMESATRERFELIADLRSALRDPDQLQLWYQPVVELRHDTIAAYESLIRWQHPTRGILLPDSFIELAEESGHIVELGWFLLEQALDQWRSWISEGTVASHCSIAINLSVRQLITAEFFTTFKSILERCGVPASLIDIELTETVFADRGSLVPRLNKLRELGVRLAIDDFGTGYSSLAYLRDLPVDVVKMDRSFVQKLGQDRRDDALVSAVIRVAHDLGLSTIAEGVETELQLTRLKELGCDRAQGYLLGVPAPQAVKANAVASPLRVR